MLVEGAGSPAEVNLRAGDIANMGFAEAADLPVVLIGDIDRGGVIASLLGTAMLLGASGAPPPQGLCHQQVPRRCPALRRRASPSSPAAAICRASASCPSSRRRRGCRRRTLASPHADRTRPTDQADQDRGAAAAAASPISTISIRCWPSPTWRSTSSPPGRALPGDADLVILPGSKSTIADLARAARRGLGHRHCSPSAPRRSCCFGLCGGYQMLGRRLADPAGIEGPARERRRSRSARS